MATVARRIILAMDGSHHSDNVFNWYVKTFYRENDHLFIVYCTEHGALLPAPVPSNDPKFISKLAGDEEVEIIKLLNSFKDKIEEAKQIHPNLKASVLRLSGRKPGELILDQVQEQSVDLILTGARGQSSLKTSRVGSVCQYIMQKSSVPVLLVREEERDE